MESICFFGMQLLKKENSVYFDERPINEFGILYYVAVEEVLKKLTVNVLRLVAEKVLSIVHCNNACLLQVLPSETLGGHLVGLTHVMTNWQENAEKLHISNCRVSYRLGKKLLEFFAASNELSCFSVVFSRLERLKRLITSSVADSFHAAWMPRVLHESKASTALSQVYEILKDNMMRGLKKIWIEKICLVIC